MGVGWSRGSCLVVGCETDPSAGAPRLAALTAAPRSWTVDQVQKCPFLPVDIDKRNAHSSKRSTSLPVYTPLYHALHRGWLPARLLDAADSQVFRAHDNLRKKHDHSRGKDEGPAGSRR